jgi:hypothetical protein
MFESITPRRADETPLDVVNAVVGVCLALTPWVLGFTTEVAAAWNAWLLGTAIALVALGALVAFMPWQGWVNLVLGLWVLVAPWALGFAGVAHATYVHLVAGTAVAVLAGVELWLVHKHSVSMS